MHTSATTAIRIVSRFGTVTIGGERYFNQVLKRFVGKQVMVRYDMKFMPHVIGVFTKNGKHICIGNLIKKRVDFSIVVEVAKKNQLKHRSYLLKAVGKKPTNSIEKSFKPYLNEQ